MRNMLTLLLVTSALSATLALPAFSAIHLSSDGSQSQRMMTASEDASAVQQLLLASDDDDDRNDDDDDAEERDDDDECDDNGDECAGSTKNPAPAGTVAPPQNGLFGNGAPPKVQVK